MSISYMGCHCPKPRPSSDWQRRILSTTGKNMKIPGPRRRADAFGQGQAAILAKPVDKSKPSFYDVSLVDGYNLPVSIDTKTGSRKCHIGGCSKSLKSMCPVELQVVNGEGEVMACKSACLAYNLDSFCCRNEYGSPEKCKPILYSKLLKDACPSYFSYAFDTPPPLINCDSDDYVITFCADKWGSERMSTSFHSRSGSFPSPSW
ncbi:unnamed protein product [Fraxinus pennsylvanica]|uniref:Thaumatin-like protein n=1 Tax=Fraxinus pennsylvanica TaxID=56036 RepID=A0AAD1YM45_9LAMI|nr:unnamed protein product [Fraxinus pennsylvanica]